MVPFLKDDTHIDNRMVLEMLLCSVWSVCLSCILALAQALMKQEF